MIHGSSRGKLAALLSVAVLAGVNSISAAATTKMILPLGRTAYQDNEAIDVAVVRDDVNDLAAGDLTITLTSADGGKNVIVLPVAAVKVDGKEASTTEHVRINGWLLRPGTYKIEATCDGATADAASIDVFSHIRKSTFHIVDWGSRANGDQLVNLRYDGTGFNTVLGEFREGNEANVEAAIRGGLDFMQVCTMSGAHQMDLRGECDWSDPYVLGGGVARGVAQAFISRTAPNALGVHLYDEPGLTWGGNPPTPWGVPSQLKSYDSAFGEEPPTLADVDPKSADASANWDHWQLWHESFMDAAWKNSAFAINQVRQDYLPITQSVYGFSAYADGYYFNVVRSLPMISGHGGYSDGPSGIFYPAFHDEYGRMRDLNVPYWYLPSWYQIPSDQYRVEQYMSFINGIQGMMKPPDHAAHDPNNCKDADGIVEANKIQSRLGTVFDEMPVTRPPVAVLFSMSDILHAEQADIAKKDYTMAAYDGGGHSRAASLMNLIASKMIGVPMLPVVDEDVMDGTVARNHKVLVVPGVDYLGPKMLTALQAYIKAGGTVLVSDDSKVEIPGAIKIGAPIDRDYCEAGGAQWKAKDGTYFKMQASGAYIKELAPYAKALAASLKAHGIDPVLESDNPSIVPGRQAQGDIEYLFAVNASNDPAVGQDAVIPAEATISLPDDGRPLYDAVRGGEDAEFAKADGKLSAKLRFGAGEMRAWARTTKPIGGVQALPPVQFADFTVAENPIRVDLTAVLMSSDNTVLSGAAPMHIIVTDPLGGVRYDLIRATNHGMLRLTLPLAANDAPGKWTVSYEELLSGKSTTNTFDYVAPTSCGALAGALPRAVYFGKDRENIFRFLQTYHDVTIAIGTSDFDKAGADRLTKVLEPWGIKCKTVNAADISAARTIPEDAQHTWCGLAPGKPSFKADDVSQTGFNVDGPVVLIGNPTDNPLIAFAEKTGFMAYKSTAGQFPGVGRGYIGWQNDAVGYFNQQSISLIAFDAKGMDQAVGSVYECAAAIDPLTALTIADVTVAPATAPASPTPTDPKVAWTTMVPDRVLGLSADGDKITVYTDDGSTSELDGTGKVTSTTPGDLADLTKAADAASPRVAATTKGEDGLVPKLTIKTDAGTVTAYWGGMVRVVDDQKNVKFQHLFLDDIGGVAASNGKLIVGLSDGTVVALDLK